MIALDYALSDEWNKRAPLTNWLSADDVALRYWLFRGDQIIIVNGVDFSARWGWVPLLDFAAALVHVARELTKGSQESRLTFTESDEALEFHPESEDVFVTSTYSDGTAVVKCYDLADAANIYARRVYLDAISIHPDLARNSSFNRWFPGAMDR